MCVQADEDEDDGSMAQLQVAVSKLMKAKVFLCTVVMSALPLFCSELQLHPQNVPMATHDDWDAARQEGAS